MAQFTVQGRLKLLFNNDGTHCKLLGNDFLGGLRSSQTQKRKIRSLGANCTKLYAAASLSKKSKHFYTVASQSVSEASDEDYDSERDELACFRGLVLDISYRPVNVVCWKRAMCLEFMEKADVLEYYDQAVNSPSGSFYIPAVLRVPHLLQVVKRRRIFRSKLSRKNILHRDNYTCQYCSSRENLTIDHVLPTAQGGEWQWENLLVNFQTGALPFPHRVNYNWNTYYKLQRWPYNVTACAKCNSKKGKKTPEEANMKLSKVPKAPKDYDILAIPLTSAAIRMLRIRKGMPEEWQQYLARPSSEP